MIKSQISELTLRMNEEQSLVERRMTELMREPEEIDRFLQKHDPGAMLAQMERGLKTCQYTLDRIIRNGTEHFHRLALTTQDEYDARLKTADDQNKGLRKNIVEVFEGNPFNALLNFEGRKGPIKICLQGVPSAAQVLISEYIFDPTPQNATWVFAARRVIEFDPAALREKTLKHPTESKDAF